MYVYIYIYSTSQGLYIHHTYNPWTFWDNLKYNGYLLWIKIISIMYTSKSGFHSRMSGRSNLKSGATHKWLVHKIIDDLEVPPIFGNHQVRWLGRYIDISYIYIYNTWFCRYTYRVYVCVCVSWHMCYRSCFKAK